MQKHWNENVKRGRKALSIRAFAEFYKLSYGRLQRELKAGYPGLLLRDQGRGGWMYPEYSAPPPLAQRRAEGAKAAKGRRSVVTNRLAERLVAEGAPRTIHTMATDRNASEPEAKGHGCEFPDPSTLERRLHAPVHTTHAYVSWEKARQRPPPFLVPQRHRFLQGLPLRACLRPSPPQRHLPPPPPEWTHRP